MEKGNPADATALRIRESREADWPCCLRGRDGVLSLPRQSQLHSQPRSSPSTCTWKRADSAFLAVCLHVLEEAHPSLRRSLASSRCMMSSSWIVAGNCQVNKLKRKSNGLNDCGVTFRLLTDLKVLTTCRHSRYTPDLTKDVWKWSLWSLCRLFYEFTLLLRFTFEHGESENPNETALFKLTRRTEAIVAWKQGAKMVERSRNAAWWDADSQVLQAQDSAFHFSLHSRLPKPERVRFFLPWSPFFVCVFRACSCKDPASAVLLTLPTCCFSSGWHITWIFSAMCLREAPGKWVNQANLPRESDSGVHTQRMEEVLFLQK